MASKYEIEMDFEEAKAQAQKLDDAADSLSQISSVKFETTLENIAASWRGESANLYLQKGEMLQGQMNGTASELRSIAAEIRRIAKKIYDAEMENYRRAKRRKHH